MTLGETIKQTLARFVAEGGVVMGQNQYAIWTAKRRQAGLCIKCNEPAATGHLCCQQHVEYKRRRSKCWAEGIKAEAIVQYGGACVCCGEDTLSFLTLDHLQPVGGGAGRLKGVLFYRELKKLGWPKENLRVLCCNCNSGRQFNDGVCPHVGLRADRNKRDRYRTSTKRRAMSVYGGGSCCCCGESNLGFLTLDHINPVGRGRERLSGFRFYLDLKKQGWPVKGLQVLCWNCNVGKHVNGGTCPHEGAA